MAIPSLSASGCVGKTATIYALIDSRDETAFYVGVTTRPLHARLGSHRNDALHLKMQTEKSDLIRAIELSGNRAKIAGLETVPFEGWVEAEQFWIAYLRSLGVKLTNLAIGGPGGTGARQTAASNRLRSEAAQGRDMSALHTPENRERAYSKTRRPVVIDGVEYPGIAAASRALGIGYSTLHYRLDVGLADRLMPRQGSKPRSRKGRPSGDRHHKSRPVDVDGIAYVSRLAACRAHDVSQSVMRTWLLNGRAVFADGGSQLQPPKKQPVKGRARGAKNFNSRAVLIDGKSFATIRDARAALGVGRKRFFKLIESGQAQFAA